MRNYNYQQASEEEYTLSRLKAYLDFGEIELLEDLKKSNHQFQKCSYYNSRNEIINGIILIERKNGDIIVENEFGCNICLTKERLID